MGAAYTGVRYQGTMRSLLWVVGWLSGCGGMGASRAPVVEVGAAAPVLALSDLDGTARRWSPEQGPGVVLWLVADCAYADDVFAPGGALDELPAATRASGASWWSVVVGGEAASARRAAQAWGLEGPVLHDADGAAAAAWGVRSGPQAFVLDAQGAVRYHGAIDNQPLRQTPGDRVAYLADAIDAVRRGERAPVPRSRPYGCPLP